MNGIDERTERLIQDVLDGTATAAEQARLRELEAADPAVRARRAELAPLFRALDAVGSAEPPADLRASVMRAIDAEPRRSPSPAGWLDGLRAALARRPGLALSYGFATGVLIGVTALAMLSGGLGPRVRALLPVTGTMAPLPARTAGSLVARQVLRVGDANVTLETWRDLGTVELVVRPGAATGLETEVVYDEPALQTMGVTWSRPGRHALDVGPGRAVATQAGDEPFRLALAANADAPLHVRLRRADATAECTLPVGPGAR